MPQTTKQDRQKMYKMYLSGKSTTQIAKALGYTKRTVQIHLKKQKIFVGRPNLDAEALCKHLKDGMSIVSIAKKYGVNTKTVTKKLTESDCYRLKELTWSGDNKRSAVQMYLNGTNIATIARQLKVSEPCVLHHLQRRQIWKYKGVKHYHCNENFFHTINNIEKAYWLGFIAADGNVYRNCLHIGLSIRDTSHILSFKKSILSNHPISQKKSCKYGKTSITSNIDIYSKKIVSDLLLHGIKPAKTLTLNWLDCVRSFKKNSMLMKAFFLGFFDGDGSWKGNKKLQFSIGCASQDFIINARDFIANECKLNKVAVMTRIPKNKNHNLFYIFYYGGNKQMRKIKDWLYPGYEHICLKRKKDKVEAHLLKISQFKNMTSLGNTIKPVVFG